MTKDLLVDSVLELIVVRESLARGSIGNAKVLRQARYIVVRHCNSGMSAAVAGTLFAVESLNRCSLVCAEDVTARNSSCAPILQQVAISQLLARRPAKKQPPAPGRARSVFLRGLLDYILGINKQAWMRQLCNDNKKAISLVRLQ
jgi:hypothetical protein